MIRPARPFIRPRARTVGGFGVPESVDRGRGRNRGRTPGGVGARPSRPRRDRGRGEAGGWPPHARSGLFRAKPGNVNSGVAASRAVGWQHDRGRAERPPPQHLSLRWEWGRNLARLPGWAVDFRAGIPLIRPALGLHQSRRRRGWRASGQPNRSTAGRPEPRGNSEVGDAPPRQRRATVSGTRGAGAGPADSGDVRHGRGGTLEPCMTVRARATRDTGGVGNPPRRFPPRWRTGEIGTVAWLDGRFSGGNPSGSAVGVPPRRTNATHPVRGIGHAAPECSANHRAGVMGSVCNRPIRSPRDASWTGPPRFSAATGKCGFPACGWSPRRCSPRPRARAHRGRPRLRTPGAGT